MKNPDPGFQIHNLKNNKTYGYPGPDIQKEKAGDHENSLRQQEFLRDVLIGLSENPKKLPSKYLYDDKGSEIFQEIMELDEYYLTRSEHEILENHGKEIISFVQQNTESNSRIHLIELGAGDGKKTSLLLRELCSKKAPFEYAPIDISEGAMISLMQRLERDFERHQIQSKGIISDYLDGINWLQENKTDFNFVLFLGSNIGNFDQETARHFLLKLWEVLSDGDCLLIGFDLKKEIQILQEAYSDAEGVTNRFNKNLLSRINRELNANFDTKKFQHYATYNPVLGAMESYLISLESQVVHIDVLNRSFFFDEKEPIHTEYSFKYAPQEIKKLSLETGFELVKSFYDKKNFFVDSLWRVDKKRTKLPILASVYN